MRRSPLMVSAVVLAALAVGGRASACVCADEPLGERLDDSDAAVVGRITGRKDARFRGAPVTLLTVEVRQRVKGDAGSELVVRSPRGSDCDLEPSAAPVDEAGTTGLLLERAPDGATWLGSACSVVESGTLVAEGGEPRGGPIKVVVGLAILGLVLLWSFRRLRRGARPDLPGSPR